MRVIKNKPAVILIAAAIIMLTAVGAYTYWTSNSAGAGTAATGTSGDVSVIQTSTITAMGPGVAAQTLTGNFDNSGSGPSYVGSVTVVVSDTSATGCTAADYTITGSPMTVNAQVPAGDARGAWTGATIAFANSATDNQDACQGATVNLAYEVVN
jgi:hypothetical protein